MTDAASAARLLTIAESNHVIRIFSSIAFGILWYDFVLTIPLEVERYWTVGRSWPSIFYFLNRYMSVLSHIPLVIEFFAVLPERVRRSFSLYHELLSALTQCIVGVLLILRTYALCNRNRKVVYLLSSICGVGGAISLWAIVSVGGLHVQSFQGVTTNVGCDLIFTKEQCVTYLAAAWSSILIFDTTVFILTLVQALRVGRTWSHSLFYIMLRDGDLLRYASPANVLPSSAWFIFGPSQPIYRGVSATLTNVISSTLITRLMLNIRDPKLYERPHRWPSEILEI
ncbi:hypothetical protein BD414DRAFT_567523 [Trametes punicea]|nr:hypothetical protein BD414DRAFT_567523 [Trametes punicea]